jgi:hypothetical protein
MILRGIRSSCGNLQSQTLHTSLLIKFMTASGFLLDFERPAMQTTTARELCDQMLQPDPDWGNPSALWTSARAVKP